MSGRLPRPRRAVQARLDPGPGRTSSVHALLLVGVYTCSGFGEASPVSAEDVPAQNQAPAKPKLAHASSAKHAAAQPRAPAAKPKPGKKKAKLSPQPQAALEAAAPEAVAPLPAAVAAAPAPVAVTRVDVPSTRHVHVEVPAGLQAWLNADDRMRPWLSKAMAATDACYADERTSSPRLAGAIAFTLTMHENARPSATVNSVSAGLQGMVLCVSARLMTVKLPLFTGKEGAAYAVHVHFDP